MPTAKKKKKIQIIQKTRDFETTTIDITVATLKGGGS